MGKRIQKVSLNNLESRVLNLGYVGEHEHTRIEIDCTDVLWDYPNAECSMVVQPPTGDMYPLTPVRDENSIIWLVTDSDVVYNGTGRVQITFTNDGEIVKSAIASTRIDQSIMATGPVPTPLENWMEQAEETARQMAQEAADATVEDLAEEKEAAIAEIQQAAEDARETIPADYTQLSDDVSELKEDFDRIDSAVNAQGIYVETESQPIVSISDGADDQPMKAVKVAIEPVQDLHGYDAPWPAGGGKNKAHITYTSNTVGGIAITVNSDGTFTTNGTVSEDKTILIGTYDGVPGTEYILTGCPSGGGTSTYRLFASSLGNDTGNGTTGTYNSGATNISLQFYAGANMNGLTFKPMVRISSESDATFAPYSNVCPITGWTGAKVTRTAKNLFDETLYRNLMTTYEYLSGSYRCRKIQLAPNTTYTISQRSGTAENVLILLNNNAQVNSGGFFDCRLASCTKTYTTDSTGCLYIGTYTDGDSTYNARLALCKLQIEDGSQATAYEEYRGQTYEVTFPADPGTVYGGTLDVVSGKLVVDHRIIDLGSVNWNYLSSSSPYFYTGLSAYGAKNTESMDVKLNNYCSAYKPVKFYEFNDFCVAYYQNNVRIKDSRYTDAASFKTAVIGVTYCFELAQTIEIDLTTTEIKTLLCINNVWADAGDTSVTYPADTKLYIDKKIAELQALILENNG